MTLADQFVTKKGKLFVFRRWKKTPDTLSTQKLKNSTANYGSQDLQIVLKFSSQISNLWLWDQITPLPAFVDSFVGIQPYSIFTHITYTVSLHSVSGYHGIEMADLRRHLKTFQLSRHKL